MSADHRIRALRAPKPYVDPWRAHGSVVEHERRPDGTLETALTVFLAGSECPFTCSFCDLWRFTLDGPTPTGALPKQIDAVLRAHEDMPVSRLKLYNASNFFDRRAVPVEDLPTIAALSKDFDGVTVESHATMVGPQTVDFARRLRGRLEVAVGLETIHPVAVQHLNKRMDFARFDRAAGFLGDRDIDLRVFVLLGAPYITGEEQVEWTIRTAAHASQRGAAVVSVIPVRGGNGEMERLASLGHFRPPTLPQLEQVLDGCIGLGSRTVFTADLWDIDRLSACTQCRAARVERLRQINLSGQLLARVSCVSCNA